MDDDVPYLLLTPGPLTTSRSVRHAMRRDWCTWDADYNSIVSRIRERLVRIAGGTQDRYTAVLMQGSGTFALEATIGSVIPDNGRVLIVNNGAYGQRIADVAQRLKIRSVQIVGDETEPADVEAVRHRLDSDPSITHVALVHCETTTGLLNPAAEIGTLAYEHGKIYIVDAMSSFGGIPYTIEDLGADFLVTSANKCLQGIRFRYCHRSTVCARRVARLGSLAEP